MDQSPRFEAPDPTEPERRRKKRGLFEDVGFDDEPETPLPIYEQAETADATGEIQELWNREVPQPEAATPIELEVPEFATDVHEHGRQVADQSTEVSAFAKFVREGVDDLSTNEQAELAPEATRLDSATENLDAATEDLQDDLEVLDQTTSYQTAAEHAESTAADTPEAPIPKVEKPKPDKEESGATGMARLVIATLIGGGLGALIGGEEYKKRKEAKEKAKLVKRKEAAEQTVKQQEVTIAQQKTELEQLKTQRGPEGTPPQKEVVKSASDLAERQVDLTRETAEQVREATEVVETSRTFHIPEQRVAAPEHVGAKAVEAGADILQPQTAERLMGDKADRRDIEDSQPLREYIRSTTGITRPPTAQSQPTPQQHTPQPMQPRRQAAQTAVYVVLLALAAAIMLGLLIFGSR